MWNLWYIIEWMNDSTNQNLCLCHYCRSYTCTAHAPRSGRASRSRGKRVYLKCRVTTKRGCSTCPASLPESRSFQSPPAGRLFRARRTLWGLRLGPHLRLCLWLWILVTMQLGCLVLVVWGALPLLLIPPSLPLLSLLAAGLLSANRYSYLYIIILSIIVERLMIETKKIDISTLVSEFVI